jgi:hypothetical protein
MHLRKIDRKPVHIHGLFQCSIDCKWAWGFFPFLTESGRNSELDFKTYGLSFPIVEPKWPYFTHDFVNLDNFDFFFPFV